MEIKLKSQLKKITTFIFDVDGVMTNALVTSFDATDLGRTYNVRDGFAMQVAIKQGFEVAVITGGKQESIVQRLSKIGIKQIYLGVPLHEKLRFFDEFKTERGLQDEQCVFMGDDLPDYGIMAKRNVLSACPADSVDEILSVANYVSPKIGGAGAVRDVIELVLKAQGKWDFHLKL
jgi:3-deoxy-D-manno-octulosonate 8-phosphate phosphatase (KDO 8-P phosphatase)